MTDELAKREKDIGWAVATTAMSAIGAVGTALAGLQQASPLGAALGALVVQGVRLRVLRSEALVQGYASAAPRGTSPEEAAADLKAMEEEPATRDAVYETFQRMLAAVDDAVIPALGRLCYLETHGQLMEREYWRLSRRVFRSAGRLLCEIDAEQFKALREIVRHVVSQTDSPLVDVNAHGQRLAPEAVAVLKLMVAYDLADPTPMPEVGSGRAAAGPHLAQIQCVVAVALRKALDPA